MKAHEASVLLRRCREIYVARQKSRYGHSGWMARLFFCHGSYIALSIPGDYSFVAAFEIDGGIGAYMEGYVNLSRKALEVPRIAINDTFKRYSPGLLLVLETLRWLEANSAIRTIDQRVIDENTLPLHAPHQQHAERAGIHKRVNRCKDRYHPHSSGSSDDPMGVQFIVFTEKKRVHRIRPIRARRGTSTSTRRRTTFPRPRPRLSPHTPEGQRSRRSGTSWKRCRSRHGQ